ncbi:MAG: hypothetical protein ACAI44_18545, partial [Candidatus Sericytochromatia bacterium]
EAWQPGKNALQVIFFKNKGVGTYEIDGGLSYRDAGSQGELKPLPHIAFGAYAAVLEANDTKPKEIQVKTSSGQSFTFTVTPAPSVKLARINGKAEGAEIDTSKDLVLELENPGNDPNSRLRVSLLTTVQGIKTFVDIGVFKPAARLVIPAAAFRNPAITSSAAGFVGFDPGPNFLRVERYQVRGSESLSQRPVAAFQNLGVSWSTLPVTLSGRAGDISRIELKGQTMGANQKPIRYQIAVPNAFYGRPFSAGKNFGVGSLQLEGTLYEQSTTSSEHYGYGYIAITTTTITNQFPQLPDAYWDQLLQSVNGEFASLLKKQHGINLVPTEKLMQAKTYAELEDTPVENTYRFVQRSYKGSKYLLPHSVGAVLNNVSSTFASDKPLARLMKETGTDGLVTMALHLQVAADANSKIVLIPVLNFQIYGPPNGYVVGPTTYATGQVAGTGVPYSSKELADPASLNRIIQLKDLMAGFQKALADLEAKEKEAGYQAIWALQ